MEIRRSKNGDALTVALKGRLDTMTAPELEEELKTVLPDAGQLTLDLEDLEYVSSAGLRVLLSAHKAMRSRGGMRIVHANDIIREIFEVTGFIDILNVE